MPVSFTECAAKDNCSKLQLGLTLDSNWRWTHNVGGYSNCFSGTSWDTSYCPDPVSCARNCAVEGVPQSDWASPYGV